MYYKNYFVYLMANKSNNVIYTGVTNNLIRRVREHRNKSIPSFTSKYNVTKLVYYETFNDINEAIKREKQLKGGSRQRKIDLIKSLNPTFNDLYQKIL